MQSIEYSIPKDASPRETLSIYRAAEQALAEYKPADGNSGPANDCRVKQREAASKLWIEIPATSKERIENLLLARAFYRGDGNPDTENVINATLAAERESLEKALTPTGESSPWTQWANQDPAGAAGLIVQVDQALLPGEAKLAQESDDALKVFSEKKIQHLTQWRQALSEAKNLSAADRLNSQKMLLTIAMQYGALSQKEDKTLPLIRGPELGNELELIQKDVEKGLTEWVQGPDAKALFAKVGNGYSEPLQKKLAEDLTARLQQSIASRDMNWVMTLDSESLVKFGQLSIVGNALQMQAEKTPGLKGMQLHFEAAQIFSKNGSNDKVKLSLSAVMSYAAKLTDPDQQIQIYKMVALTYKGSGLSYEAKEALQAISDIGKNSIDSRLQEQGKFAEAMILVNQGSLNEAKLILADLKSEEAQTLFDTLTKGQKGQRAMQMVDIYRSLINSKDFTDDKKTAMLAKLSEVQALLASGSCETFNDALAMVDRDSHFSEAIRLGDVGSKLSISDGALHTWYNKLSELEDAASTWTISDKEFSERAYGLASFALDHKDYTTASVVSQLLTDDWYVATKSKKLFGSIEGTAQSDSRWHFVKSLPGVSLFIPSAEVSDEEMLKVGVTFIGPFIIGRALAVGAELAWVAYATETLAVSPTLIRGVGIGINLLVESTTVTASQMLLESVFTGSFENWSPSKFGHGAGSFLVTMFLLRGVSATMGRVGQSFEKLSLMKAAEGAERIPGQLALNTGGKVAFGVLGYSSRILGFAGSTYFNEAIGLHEKQNLGFFDRLLDAAITDAQMIIGPDLFDSKTGGRMAFKQRLAETLQGHYKIKYAGEKFKPLVTRLGIDPHSIEGKVIVDVLLSRMMAGERIGKIEKSFEKDAEAYQGAVKTGLGVDPKSPEGQKLTAFLMNYALLISAAKKSKSSPSSAEIQQMAKQLNHEIKGFLVHSGIEGNAREEMRLGLLTLSMSRGITSEYWEGLTKHVPELNKQVELYVEAVIGKANSRSEFGKALRHKLFFDNIQYAVATGKKPEELIQRLETWVKHFNAEEKNLKTHLEGLFGKKAANGESGRELISLMLMQASLNAESPGQVSEALRSFEARLTELKPEIDKLKPEINKLLALNRRTLDADSAELAIWAFSNGKTLEDLSQLHDSILEGKVAFHTLDGALKELQIPEDKQAQQQMMILKGTKLLELPGLINANQIHPDNVRPLMEQMADQILQSNGHDPKAPEYKQLKETLIKNWEAMEKGEVQAEMAWLQTAKDLHEAMQEGRAWTMTGVKFGHALGGKHLADTAAL